MLQGKARGPLGVLLFLQGLGAIGGAIFVVPNLAVDNLKPGLFSDYTVPAIGLGVVVGGGSLLALTLLLMRSSLAGLAALAAGGAVMAFEVVEVTTLKGSILTDPNSLPLWQQPLWFVIGAAIAGLAVAGMWPQAVSARGTAANV